MSTHRPSRINPDTLPVLVLAVVLTAGLAGVSFTISYAALREVSAWATVPADLAWTVPVMLDAATVVYLLAVLVKRARHQAARGAWAALALWTAVSVSANAAHAAGVPDTWQRVVGTVVAGLAPVAVLLATHTIADLIVDRTDRTDADSPAAADAEPDRVPADTRAGEDDGAAASAAADAAADTDAGADTAPAADADANADSDPDADSDADAPARTPSGPSVVRRHPAPGRRTRGRVAEHRDEILRLHAEDERLTVREIAERVGLGKTAVAELLRRETAAA